MQSSYGATGRDLTGMLKVVFSDGFERQTKRLGVNKEAVLDFLNNADKVKEQAHNGLLVRFFLKRETQADSYLLLIAQVKESTIHPDVILRVLSDLYLNIRTAGACHGAATSRSEIRHDPKNR